MFMCMSKMPKWIVFLVISDQKRQVFFLKYAWRHQSFSPVLVHYVHRHRAWNFSPRATILSFASMALCWKIILATCNFYSHWKTWRPVSISPANDTNNICILNSHIIIFKCSTLTRAFFRLNHLKTQFTVRLIDDIIDFMPYPRDSVMYTLQLSKAKWRPFTSWRLFLYRDWV